MSDRTIEDLCKINPPVLSKFRDILAYHRTNPLFDKVVVPFFLMLKHVALFQGLNPTLKSYDSLGYRMAEERLSLRFASLICKAPRADPDNVRQTLLIMIHHSVSVFQPIWPSAFPRPPHVEDMLKPCAKYLYAYIYEIEENFGRESVEYLHLLSTSPMFRFTLDSKQQDAIINRKRQLTVERIQRSRKDAADEEAKVRLMRIKLDEEEKKMRDRGESAVDEPYDPVTGKLKGGSRRKNPPCCDHGDCESHRSSASVSVALTEDEFKFDAARRVLRGGGGDDAKMLERRGSKSNLERRDSLGRRSRSNSKSMDPKKAKALAQRLKEEKKLQKKAKEEEKKKRAEERKQREADKKKPLSVDPNRSVEEDVIEQELKLLEMKVKDLPGPFELASKDNTNYKEKDFVNWYMYEVRRERNLLSVFGTVSAHRSCGSPGLLQGSFVRSAGRWSGLRISLPGVRVRKGRL